jgi:signal transduction histidine kinase
MQADVHEPSATVAGVDPLSDVLREYMAVAERLQRTHEILQREVVRLREELASKDRELELRRRLAALGELVAGVAHEVRNPLGAIQLYSGLLKDHCSAHQLGPALQLIEKIEAGVQAIDAVVQDTLALAPRDRRLGLCRLRDILDRVRDAALKTVMAHDVKLELRLEDPEACVRADPDGLERVLVNLVINAAEASAPGRVVLVIVTRDGEQGIEIRVRDQGPGLPDEIRHRIFDPFFTTKRRGTGLGLTIAHRLTEAYGGRLSAGNRPEGGAEFVVALPRATPAAADEEQADNRQFSAA